jgi:hypothetical protein
LGGAGGDVIHGEMGSHMRWRRWVLVVVMRLRLSSVRQHVLEFVVLELMIMMLKAMIVALHLPFVIL